MTSLERHHSFCKASARRGGVYRSSPGVASTLIKLLTARPAPGRPVYAHSRRQIPTGASAPWGNPHPTNRVTFSDTCEHAIHLKSSIRELVVDEKAPSNLARAGDAVRPAQLLRDRRHHGRARRRDLVS